MYFKIKGVYAPMCQNITLHIGKKVMATTIIKRIKNKDKLLCNCSQLYACLCLPPAARTLFPLTQAQHGKRTKNS
jgi:hypothetical protein